MNLRLTFLGCCLIGCSSAWAATACREKPTAADVEPEPRQVRDFAVALSPRIVPVATGRTAGATAPWR